MLFLKRNSTQQNLLFQLIDSSDHISGKTGVTPTVTLSKAGGSFAAPAGAITEIANGWYKVAGNATDTNTLGTLVLHATGTGCDPCDVVFNVVAFDPQDATAIGLSTLTGNVPQTGDSYAIVNSATYGNAKLVRATTPANTLSVNNVGQIIGVVDVVGSVAGDVGGKVLGGGTSVISGAGAFAVADASGTAIATYMQAGGIKTKTDQLTFTVANQLDVNVINKGGFSLGATGLDAIDVTAATGLATTFPSMLVQMWRRFFKKATETSTQLKTYADDGTTVLTTQTVSNDGTTQTQGAAA